MMSAGITRKSFWAQRLLASEAGHRAPPLFLDMPPDQASSLGPEAYGKTGKVMAVSAGDLHVAAFMHHVSAETIVLTAWALLMRSYAGRDGQAEFGVCVDKEEAAWLFGADVKSDGKLLSGMRAAEEEKRVVLGSELAFKSLAEFSQGTGYGDIPAAVYIYSGKTASPAMHTEATVTLVVHVAEGGMVQAHLSFRKDALAAELAQSVVDNFGHALHTMTKKMQFVSKLEADKLLMGDIETVSKSDYRRIVGFSATPPQPLETCAHELVFSRCADPKMAVRTAVTAWDGAFTYSEVAAQANRVAGIILGAARLHAPGHTGPLYVPFCMTKSKWTPIAVLGILAAGGICVPLEPSDPPSRMNDVLAATGAKIVLTNSALFSTVAGGLSANTPVGHILCVDKKTSDFGPEPPILPRVRADSTCYVVFTSGSEPPKAVRWQHGALSTGLWVLGSQFHVGEESRVLQFSSHLYESSVYELLGPLVHGGRVTIPADDDRADAARLESFTRRLDVNCAFLTPSYARLLHPEAIPSLTTLVLSGEAIDQDIIEKWAPAVQRLVVGYGAAETGGICAKREFSETTETYNPLKEVVGTGAGARLLISDLSNTDRLVPVGGVGEIIVEGPILAEGYLEEENTDAFVENPEWTRKTFFRPATLKRRLFRTGDLGRQAIDGTITLVGREGEENLNKLGEVRAVVARELPDALDIHVEIRSDEEKSFVVFLSFGHTQDKMKVLIPGDRLAASLKQAMDTLQRSLPPNQSTVFFVPLAGFPYHVSGKLNHQMLAEFVSNTPVDDLHSYNASFLEFTSTPELIPTPEMTSMSEDSASLDTISEESIEVPAAPASDAEGILLACCRETLKMPSFGAGDNFFQSGGDSILAIKAASSARSRGVSITVEDIFVASTVRDLAKVAGVHDDGSEDREAGDIDPFSLLPSDLVDEMIASVEDQGQESGQAVDIYPCTPLQEALIALSSMRSGAYVAQYVLELPAATNLDRFKDAWAAVVEGHDILRTRMFESPHGGVQAVYDSEIQWYDGASVTAYCELDKSIPMGFGDRLVRFGLVGRTFILTIHHSLFDGWSIARVFEDVERQYARQEPLGLQQYKYFVKHLSTLDDEASKQVWARKLASDTGLASCHFPQTLAPSYNPVPDLERRLEVSTAKYASSEFTIPTRIRAAWALLVGRYIDSQDVIFGETLSGRTGAMDGVENVSGPTISTVPVRISWDSSESLAALLQDIQGEVVEITNAGHIGVQNISRLGPAAQEACQFQHLVVIQPRKSSFETSERGLKLPNRLNLDQAVLERKSFHSYALNMDFTLGEDGVTIITTFDSRVFQTRDIEHLQAQFAHVFDQICRTRNVTEAKISDIDFASPVDRELQVENNARQPLQHNRTTLVQLLERHAKSTPRAPAVEGWDGSLSYRELDSASTALANHLGSLGVRKGDYVSYCFPKSIWTTVAIMATLKTGAVSVALEPTHPDSSVAKVLNQVRPKLVLCPKAFTGRFKRLGRSTFTVDSKAIADLTRLAVGGVRRRFPVQPDDTAFAVFTSGSTGEPKGIPLQHAAVCHMAKHHGEVMNIVSSSRVLQFAAHVFDVSIGDLAIAVFHGACLCVPSEEDRMNNLAKAVNDLRGNRAWLTPTVASLISPRDCPTIKWLSVGGEQLTQACRDIWEGVPLVNVYGPAEVTNLGTAVHVSKDLPITNIGRGNGARMWVCEVGRPERLAPAGCVGEIVFEGPNVSGGYLNNPKLTAASFRELPSRIEKGRRVRMYCTGDLAKLSVDGSIEFRGRKDTQIKLRGQRIEITAVEDALTKAIPEPAELAVDILAGDSREAALVAFLYIPGRIPATANGDTGIFSTIDLKDLAVEVKARMAETLPLHMIPTLFVPLSRLPKLVSGKIDRKTLRLAAAELSDGDISAWKVDAATEKRAPTNREEEVMRGMWASVLRVPESDIGVDDNFVSLGGDSITAIKLVAQARATGVTLSVSSIFQHATISALCAALAPDKAVSTSTSTPPPTLSVSLSEAADIALQCGISPEQIEDVYPCTALQEGMLMLTEKQPTAYVAHHVMKLPSWVDESIFRRAWEAVSRENAILRTRIIPSGKQVVLRPGALEWMTAPRDLDSYVSKALQEPMGFGKLLTRQAILQGPKRFVWTAHHSIYDGWSMSLLAEALTGTYMRLAKPGRPLEITPEPTISFRAFVYWISEMDRAQATAFWQEQLAGADPAPFPPRLPSSYDPHADSLLELTIPFPRNSKAITTPAGIIRTAWALLIYAYSGSHTDVVFGSSVTGRSAPIDGIFSLIGPTLATVPVRVVLDPKEPTRDLLARVQQQSVAMLEYEQHGLQNIRAAAPEAPAACDFQSLLVVHTEGGSTAHDNRLAWSTERNDSQFLTNALTLECEPEGSKLNLVASYDSSLMDERQMRRLLATFEHILQQICRDNSKLVGDIDTLSPGDRSEIAQITKDLPPRANDLVHNMFARQAASTPDATAISAWDGELTYRQLDQLSTKLGRHLQSLGLGPECFAPFCFEKSKWVPVALLGILKAGGACVPLDPAQPLDRLGSIIDTLDARVVLTSETHEKLLTGVAGVKHFVTVSEDAVGQLPTYGRRSAKPQATPESPCYAIFTSGSTGTPKGVVWEHAALCSSMAEHGVAFNYSTSSRVLQFASHTFDVSVSELLTTFVYGGCLIIPDDFTRLNGISDFMNENRVNWTFFAPSFARLIDPTSVPGLKTIVLGGEAPGKDNIERWSNRPGLELIVTYGPAESCIYCAKNSVQLPQIEGSVGHSIGGVMWVADLARPDRLTPIGAVGEIAVEGSILARGYLKDPAKTAASFRTMPAEWAGGRSERVYYTGDLGRVNSDGSISCLGRRDDQVKIRGQRVELADIEYHLRKDERVRQALVLYPRSGPCADHLVGILSMLDQDDSRPASSANIAIAPSESWSKTFDVQEHLMEKVPAYMIPSIWIVLDTIPLMPASQKVNRKMVSEWTIAMSQSTYERIASLSSGPTEKAPAALQDELEERIRMLWSSVLNVGTEVIGPESSFLRLGGDSISAMQIISRCRNDGIHVTVQDLLKSQKFTEFCDRARASRSESSDPVLEAEDEIGAAFELSPIQTWFMKLAPGENYFNQSHLLRLTEKVGLEDLEKALVLIAQRHGMLRARFQQSDGRWKQFISDDAEASVQCRSFRSVTMKKAASYALNAQASLDIVHGPLLAADIYSMTDGRLALFITCHHLAVDLVSWKIIFQELEEILRTGCLSAGRKPLPFRSWSELVNKRSDSLATANDLNVPETDFGFWGISSTDNVPAHNIEDRFNLDVAATELLLGKANDAFSTEPLDLLLTAVGHSFNTVFGNLREPLCLFNEGHGREPWRPDIDLSSTVGWFTSMCPIPITSDGEVLRFLQEVKDFRRKVPEKGLPFFTRFAGCAATGVEATFNYLGLSQQLERDDALLNRMSWDNVTQPPDSSPDVPRFSLFDISAGVEDGSMFVNFAFNRNIEHIDLVHQWIKACSDTLANLIEATSASEQALTLSDLPHLPATQEEFCSLLENTLPEAGLSTGDVQDIYSCSPMQAALLTSQAVDPSLYAVRYIWEVVPKYNAIPSIDRVTEAWKRVVAQSPMLRTTFIQTVPFSGKNTSVHSQVVLRDLEPAVDICDPSEFPVGKPHDYIQNGPPHHLTLCEKNGSVMVQLDISHALIDGTSVNVLLDAMIKAYDGKTSLLTNQDCYAHYVDYLRDQDLDASRTFWKTHLAGVEPCQFPVLRTFIDSSGNDDRKLAYLDFTYDNPGRLHSLCTSTGTTAASVFKLAWALLLKAYTGNNAPCFGYLASGRDLPIQGIEHSIGPFINMLVCRISLEKGEDVVEDVLRATHEDYASCLEHQVCSLVDIVRQLNLGGEKLFNSVMSVQRHLPPGASDSSIEFQSVDAEDPSEFDIVLNIGDSAERVEVSLTYNTALLTTEQAKRLGSAFNKTIDGVLDSLDKPVNSVSLMPEEDHQQVDEWNSITDLTPVSTLCDDLVRKHVATQGTKVAVSGWDISMTYSDLDKKADALAEHLSSKYSLSRDTLVPFCYEKSAWAIVVMLGIMKAGAAFVPLDPKHPADRLTQIVQRIRAPLIICSEKSEKTVKSIASSESLPYLVIGKDSMVTMMKPAMLRNRAHSQPRRSPSDLAYCLFTSGSTGTPKGVLIQHQTLCSSCTAHGNAFGYTNTSRALQFASYAFDACIAEIFTILIMGGTVCVPSDAQKMDPELLTKYIRREKVDLVFLTPSFLSLLDPAKLPSVKTLLVGGEIVQKQLVGRWLGGGRRVEIVYGPTECCVYCSGFDYADRSDISPGKNFIGTTVGSVSWVTEPHNYNSLVPVGAIGELLVAGPILAKGYLDDEEKTSASFVKPDWMDGLTAYRTGDLVRYAEDGSLEYLGRRDTQVKLRGQRLELGEIEEQLIKDPNVQQCVVLLIKEGLCSLKLVAVLTFAPEDKDARVAGTLKPIGGADGLDMLAGGEVADKLSKLSSLATGVLPRYMVPSCWVVTDQMPLLPSGKADRRFLTNCIANIDDELNELSVKWSISNVPANSDAPPPVPDERKGLQSAAKILRQIWSSVLNVPEERINTSSDSFIRAGGDSISAMEVVALCRAKGMQLLIENLLKGTTIDALAAAMEPPAPASSTNSSPGAATHAEQESEEEDGKIVLFGLSPIQRMFAKLSPGESHFNQSFLLRVSDGRHLAEDEVRSALNVIVKRHAMLRARFQRLGRAFKQWIEPDVEESYTLREWVVPKEAVFPAEAVSRIVNTQKSLDLENGPVFAGDLFSVGTEQYLFLTAHHLVIDLVSWRIILKNLEDYFTHGSISSYRSLTFEKWSGLLNTHRKTLLDAKSTFVPFDTPEPDHSFWGMEGKANLATDFEHHQFTLPASISESLLGPCNDAFGSEPLDLFISAVMRSFAATFSGREIPPVFNESHGREPWDDALDLSSTVGWFTTIAPVWVSAKKCSGDIVQCVRLVKDARRRTPRKGFNYFTCYDFEKKPFDVELTFNYFGSFQQLDRDDAVLKQVHWRNIGVDPVEVADGQKKFSLIDISAEIENGQLVFTFGWNSKMRHGGDVKSWMSRCQKTLEQLARALDSRGSEHSSPDFEGLPADYDLKALQDTTLKDLDTDERNVEDIYTCSSTQQGMLLSQSKDSEMYWFRSVYEVSAKRGMTLDKLRQAWEVVVQRHPILRTVFVEQNSTDGLYDQLVLRNYEPRIDTIELDSFVDGEDLLDELKIHSIPSDMTSSRKPQHMLRIARQSSSGRIFCSFLLSHAIIDGGSMGILLRDLALAVDAKLVRANNLKYKNYITYLKSRDSDRDLAYWKGALEGVEPCLLPAQATDAPRALHKTDMPSGSSSYAKVLGAAREMGVSPFTLLQVAWALTLREFINPDCEECTFGVVTSGRDLPVDGIQDIAGPFVNILATRVIFGEDDPVEKVAERVHGTFIDNVTHQTASLAAVMHELGVGTMFNTGMTLQKILPSKERSAVEFNPIGGDDPTEFDVVVHAVDTGRSLDIHMNHWADKVPDSRASEMARVFSTILSQISEQPDIRPTELHIAPQEDIEQVWSWNADLTPTVDKRIEEMISAQAARNPHREALWSAEETISYQQLDAMASRLAHSHLADLSKEEIVPLCFEKSIWAAVAMVAVLKAGGTVVLMDPTHPVERLKTIVGTVKARLVLASPSQTNLCSRDVGVRTVTISKEVFNRRSSMPGTLARSTMQQRKKSSADAAYIVFTSGSTGTPKGSVTEHRAFATATTGYHKAIGQLPGTRVLQFASYSFDASILEVLGSLMVGATVCVPAEEERANGLAAFINKAKVTFAVITPTVASLLSPDDVPTLSCLALCGEPMTTSHIERWADRVRLVNAFGPSECCVGSAANQRVTRASSPKCIGWAVSCCYWVAHPRNHHRLARVGSVGELLIEGPILARHYLGEEEKTRAAFVDAPEWARPGRATRLYKTGDLVYQNPDGSFQYVGRKDAQAKIRGQRLELGDVEQAFRGTVPCNNCVAEVVKSSGSQSRLVVFFSGEDTRDADPASVDLGEIQKKMGEKLPAYMVPAAVIPLTQLPTMPSGKVDRKKIRSLGTALPARKRKRAGRLPETEMEVALAALWKDVVRNDRIQTEQVLADDSFFEVGGDSYTAMRLVTEAREHGIALNVSIVMKTPKLSEMARKATKSTASTPEIHTTEPFSMINWTPEAATQAARQCGVKADNIDDVYPCTPLQEGLFVLSVKQPGSYIAQHCYSLSPELDLDRYKRAWSTVYESSSILRTHIVQLNNVGGASGRKSGLYQAVVKKPLAWERATSLDDYLETQPLPSIGGALAQFTVIEEPDERYLVLTMHHAAYDATSLAMLLNSVEGVYTDRERPSATPFREFIKYLESNKGQMTEEFWSECLDGARPSSFPAIPVGYVPSADSNFSMEVTIPRTTGEFTVSTIIRAAWATVIARHMGSNDVVFGETLSGRNDAANGLVGVEGPLITTVPVRHHFDNSATVQEVLRDAQIRMIDMIPYQHAGLQNIRLMSPDAAAACNFTCLVTISHAADAEPKPSLGITPIEGPEAVAMDYPMSAQFLLGHRSVTVTVSFDEQLIDEAQMRCIVEQFGHVMTQLWAGQRMSMGKVEVNTEVYDGGMGPLVKSPQDILDRIANLGEDISTQNLSKADTESVGKVSSLANIVAGPVADLEADFRSLWAEILGMEEEEIQLEDNFFHLGGDSIGAMRLVTSAEAKGMKTKVTVADVFHHPTLEDLVVFAAQSNPLSSGPKGSAEASAVEYTPYSVLEQLGLRRTDVLDGVCRQLSVFPGDVEDVYPATDYQAWAVSHGLMRSRGNTNYFLFRLHGDLDTFRLEQACRKMVASNAILRTLFTAVRGQVMQVVLRSYQIEFQRYGREHRADDGFIRWLVEQDTQRSTHLSQSIVRFKLLRHIQGHYVLIMRVSHAQYDGMSLPLLYQDLETCYGGLEPADRPSFGSFIHASALREAEAVKFWSGILEGSSMTDIVQHSGPAYKHNVDTIRRRRLPPVPTSVAGMSQATIVKAAWALVLAKMSGNRDIVFGNLVFGRNIPVPGIDEVSGPCINMIPVRVAVNEMDSIHDLLALVQEQQLAAMSHESLGFRKLIKQCTDWPDWTRFSSVVQHQNLGRDGSQELRLGDNLRCEMGVLGPAYDSSDLWVQTTPAPDSFQVEIGSCSAVVSPDIAETLLDRLCAILNVFSSVGSGNGRHLWELLARDHAPLIPIKSSIVDRVWSSVLPEAGPVSWDAPYYELWGDEIAPVRFLEEYAEHGIVLEMEDILEHPTKQSQMMLTARVLADRNGTSRDSAPNRSFWVHGSSSTPSSGRSRGSSASTSPLSGSPQINPVAPRKSFARRRSSGMKYSASSSGSYWDMPSQAAWSDSVKSSVNSSSPARSSTGRSRSASDFSGGRTRRKRSVQW